jgi:hypothetical protein
MTSAPALASMYTTLNHDLCADAGLDVSIWRRRRRRRRRRTRRRSRWFRVIVGFMV